MPVTSAMSRRTKTKTPTIQPAHSRTEGVTTLRISSMVWRIKRPMVMNGLAMVVILGTMRRAGMESPSPARGRVRSPILLGGSSSGITPACAGKSRRMPPHPRSYGNHPRMRGEESTSSARSLPPPESPPRARGRGSIVTASPNSRRITPACAGKRVLKMRPPRIWSYPLSANFSLFSKSRPQAPRDSRTRDRRLFNFDTPVIEITGFLRTGLACRHACRMMAEASYF